MASTADRAANSTPRLRLDRAEFAGSLGDLGTFIPLLTPGAPNALHRLIREAIDQRNVPLDDVVKRWLTVSDCAGLLLNDVSGLDLNKAKARVSWAAGKRKFRTNGEKGNARRIDRDSFSTWRLEQRERDLDADDEEPQ